MVNKNNEYFILKVFEFATERAWVAIYCSDVGIYGVDRSKSFEDGELKYTGFYSPCNGG